MFSDLYKRSAGIISVILLLSLPLNGLASGSDGVLACPSVGYDPVDSLEGLLRNQSTLLDSFDHLLRETPTSSKSTAVFLTSFEDLLRRQAILLSSFDEILKSGWRKMNRTQMEAFLASYNDLLDRQGALLESFQNLTNERWDLLTPDNRLLLATSFEDLLRREAELLSGYKELHKMTYGGISIEKMVDKIWIKPGDTIMYVYLVTNYYEYNITELLIVDYPLGEIASGFTLLPGETKRFEKSIVLDLPAVNIVRVEGRDPNGTKVEDKSPPVSVGVIRLSMNYDELQTGNQSAHSSGIDPPSATNSVEVKKSQRTTCNLNEAIINMEKIRSGDQTASSYGTGATSNQVRFIVDQE